MKAVVYSAPEEFTIREVPDPVPAAGEIVIRSTLAGVCGTDLHLHAGEFDAKYPLTPGHEITGEVVSWGAGVEGFRVGQHVVVDNASACGNCPQCGRGEPLYCQHFRSLGVNGPGGFAELVVTRADKCFAADDLPPDVAVLAEPLACAVHGMDVLQLRPGADVAMIGSGTTGMLLAQMVLHGGASRVTMASPSGFKLQLAKSFGIDRIVEVSRSDARGTAATLKELSPGGYDVVIDATGASSVVQHLPELVKDNGTVLVYGMCDEADRVAWSPYEIFRRQLTIKGSFAQVNCFDRSLAMLRSGRIRVDGLITHRFRLDQYGEALAAVRSDPTCLKAVVVP
ncbi:2-deoxy-scyllo-inosamine dehydrogenase [mine drainage metagenome]|uniref:2-deoxy-scyllo-inosamine dehydrogenase n=1 Tax=mine drainage metagenome TaxID=410659 RepID=A0A1J5QB93_9ZZZZ